MAKTDQKRDLNPPETLGKAGKKFWRSVLEDYVVDETHHLRLLEIAATSLDRAEAAREKIEAEGVTIANRFKEIVAHPACNIERQAMAQFRASLRELALDCEVPSEVRGPRPTGQRS